MATFDDLLEKTVDEGRLPGVVLLARDRDGKKTLLISLFYFCFPISSPLSRGEGAWDERSVADQCRIDQVSSLSGKGASPRARGKKRGEKKANQGGKPPFLINRQARLCQGVRAQVDRAGQRPAGTAGHGVPAGVVVQAADDDRGAAGGGARAPLARRRRAAAPAGAGAAGDPAGLHVVRQAAHAAAGQAHHGAAPAD